MPCSAVVKFHVTQFRVLQVGVGNHINPSGHIIIRFITDSSNRLPVIFSNKLIAFNIVNDVFNNILDTKLRIFSCWAFSSFHTMVNIKLCNILLMTTWPYHHQKWVLLNTEHDEQACSHNKTKFWSVPKGVTWCDQRTKSCATSISGAFGFKIINLKSLWFETKVAERGLRQNGTWEFLRIIKDSQNFNLSHCAMQKTPPGGVFYVVHSCCSIWKPAKFLVHSGHSVILCNNAKNRIELDKSNQRTIAILGMLVCLNIMIVSRVFCAGVHLKPLTIQHYTRLSQL